jgi:hypothetical protein
MSWPAQFLPILIALRSKAVERRVVDEVADAVAAGRALSPVCVDP